MTSKIVNAIGYQAVWFISVMAAARGNLLAGPLAAAAFSALTIAHGGHRRADLLLVPFALLAGLATDSAWIALGWFRYGAAWPSAAWSPAWILGIWVAFALTLNHAMAFLRGRMVLAAILGAVGGPVAYWSASHGFGALRIDAPVATALIGVGMAWAVLFPLLVRLAEGIAALVRPAMPR